MELLTVRDTEVLLPGIEVGDLDRTTELGADERDFLYAEKEVRQLDLTDNKLRAGLFCGRRP